jgi:tetratricopeptide (TPR) repeat protein
VPRTIVTAMDARSIDELLRDADELLAQQRFADAARAYDRAHSLDPDGGYAVAALWGAGDAYDRVPDHQRALLRYRELEKRGGDDKRVRQARVRATRLLVFLGRFAEAGPLADRAMSGIEELGVYDRIAVLSAKALSLIEGSDDNGALYHVEKARNIVEANRLDAAGRLSRDLAQLFFALGEVRRVRAERITFEPMTADFPLRLEARCQLLLDAQSAYSDSMRAYDARWSAMAGFRVAELYQNLHRDLLAVRSPSSAETERQRQLFEGAVRLRYAILLTKARVMAEHTLAMAERAGEKSEWVTRTRKTLELIEERKREEEEALAALPYARADYEAYFQQMEQAAKRRTAK